METQNIGILFKKLTVPSKASIIQIEFSFLGKYPCSSESIESSGYRFFNESMIKLSDMISNSVTTSLGDSFWFS